MRQESVLRNLIDALNICGVDYMFTGAVAVNYFGRPRLTHDVDILVELKPEHIRRFMGKFAKEFYIAKDGLEDAIEEEGMFNAIHKKTALKVDFWTIKSTLYDQTRFPRRKRVKMLGKRTWISSPEDMIIVKLDWFRRFKDRKHHMDAEGIYKIQKNKLDMRYLAKWARHHKVYGMLRDFQKLEEVVTP